MNKNEISLKKAINRVTEKWQDNIVDILTKAQEYHKERLISEDTLREMENICFYVISVKQEIRDNK